MTGAAKPSLKDLSPEASSKDSRPFNVHHSLVFTYQKCFLLLAVPATPTEKSFVAALNLLTFSQKIALKQSAMYWVPIGK
jgi:hypothetical protein